MSEIMLNVRDADGALHTTVHASRVEPLVAALSADPETIAELQAALSRFLPVDARREFFARWRSGIRPTPWDAGLCVIDLAARVVVLQSSYSRPGPRGAVTQPHASHERDAAVRYHVAEDWLFLHEGQDWEALADERRRQRLAVPRLDARAVLFGNVCEFIAEAIGNVPGDVLHTADRNTAYHAISAIHARWLTSQRDDLGGLAPRDVLLSRREHLSRDLQDRADQWSTFDACPPGLSPDVAAYRYGGFGTHEIVLYYKLIRLLLWECWERRKVTEVTPDQFALEVRRLEALRDRWLETPDLEILHGRTPASVIARERSRLPEGMTGAEAVVDHDCPMCQMMAELPGPTFWHLDGCNMDHEFAFSFHRTRAEWDAEEREYEEFSRRCDERRLSEPMAETETVWKTSHVNEESLAKSPTMALWGVGAHLSELTLDLKDKPGGQELIDQLNRAFGNLRATVDDPSAALVEPVTERMCECLSMIAEAHPALAEKCADLEGKLCALAHRLTNGPRWNEELPF
jgi:hypothetical protein